MIRTSKVRVKRHFRFDVYVEFELNDGVWGAGMRVSAGEPGDVDVVVLGEPRSYRWRYVPPESGPTLFGLPIVETP